MLVHLPQGYESARAVCLGRILMRTRQESPDDPQASCREGRADVSLSAFGAEQPFLLLCGPEHGSAPARPSSVPLPCSSARCCSRSASRLSSLPLFARLSSTTFTSLPSRTARLEM